MTQTIPGFAIDVPAVELKRVLTERAAKLTTDVTRAENILTQRAGHPKEEHPVDSMIRGEERLMADYLGIDLTDNQRKNRAIRKRLRADADEARFLHWIAEHVVAGAVYRLSLQESMWLFGSSQHTLVPMIPSFGID